MATEVGLRAKLSPSVDERETEREVSKISEIMRETTDTITPDIDTSKIRAGLGRATGRKVGDALPGGVGTAAGGVLGEFLAGGPGTGGGPGGAEGGENLLSLTAEQNDLLREILESVEGGAMGGDGDVPGGGGGGGGGILGLLRGGGIAGGIGTIGSVLAAGGAVAGGMGLVNEANKRTGVFSNDQIDETLGPSPSELFKKFLSGGDVGLGEAIKSVLIGNDFVKTQAKGLSAVAGAGLELGEDLGLIDDADEAKQRLRDAADYVGDQISETAGEMEDLITGESVERPQWVTDLMELDIEKPGWLTGLLNFEFETPEWISDALNRGGNMLSDAGKGASGFFSDFFGSLFGGNQNTTRGLRNRPGFPGNDSNQRDISVNLSPSFNIDTENLRDQVMRDVERELDDALRDIEDEIRFGLGVDL